MWLNTFMLWEKDGASKRVNELVSVCVCVRDRDQSTEMGVMQTPTSILNV